MIMSLLGKSDYSLVPTHVLHEYAAMDADATRRIYFPLVNSLKKQDLAGYYKSFTSKTLRNLIKSSLIGMCIDKDLLNKQGKIFLNAIEELEIHLKKTAGDSFNPNSPKQLVEVLYEQLDLPVLEKTPTGNPSTNKEVLELLVEKTDCSFVRHLLEFRALSKLYSTYVVGLSNFIDDNNIVHPTFKISGTITGRITSENPPATTLPRDKSYLINGKSVNISVREFFSCPEGYELCYADISQAELRVAAIVSKDKVMLKLLESKEDLHTATARSIMGLSLTAEVDKEDRRLAKTANFGILFGGSAASLAKRTGVSVAVMEDFMEQYLRTFKGIAKWRTRVSDYALSKGELASPFGRKKRVVPYLGSDEKLISEQSRQLVNFIPQNGAAEITVRAYNRICARMEKENIEGFPINMVYDSILVQYKIEYREVIKDLVLKEMLTPVKELDNQIFPCSYGYGNNWSVAENSAKEVYNYNG